MATFAKFPFIFQTIYIAVALSILSGCSINQPEKQELVVEPHHGIAAFRVLLDGKPCGSSDISTEFVGKTGYLHHRNMYAAQHTNRRPPKNTDAGIAFEKLSKIGLFALVIDEGNHKVTSISCRNGDRIFRIPKSEDKSIATFEIRRNSINKLGDLNLLTIKGKSRLFQKTDIKVLTSSADFPDKIGNKLSEEFSNSNYPIVISKFEETSWEKVMKKLEEFIKKNKKKKKSSQTSQLEGFDTFQSLDNAGIKFGLVHCISSHGGKSMASYFIRKCLLRHPQDAFFLELC